MHIIIVTVRVAFIILLLRGCSHEPLRDGSAEADTFDRDLLAQINRYRVSNGLKPLTFDKKLAAIAKVHRCDMNKCRVLSHDKFQQRFERSRHTSCVENVAKGYRNRDILS